MSTTDRWRGLISLLSEAVDEGAGAVERVHLETAARPFKLIAWLPGLRTPLTEIKGVHDFFVRAAYGSVRAGARCTKRVADFAFDTLSA